MRTLLRGDSAEVALLPLSSFLGEQLMLSVMRNLGGRSCTPEPGLVDVLFGSCGTYLADANGFKSFVGLSV